MAEIVIVGDCCPQFQMKRILSNAKNYDSILGEMRESIKAADYAIVNLETPILKKTTKPIGKCGPNFQCPPQVLDLLKWAGFSCCTLANNHFFDFGQEGVEQTLLSLKENNFDFVGGDTKENMALLPLKKVIGGIKFALINCCEHEFSIAEEGHGGSNPLNPITQYYSIKEVRGWADYVIVIVHGGTEHYQLPSPRMQETYRFFIEAGADVVVNHHQHCTSGFEVYKEKPIFYGLGNFLYDHPHYVNDKFNQGLLLKLTFSKSSGGIKWSFQPFWQCNGNLSVFQFSDAEKSLFEEEMIVLNQTIKNPHEIKQRYAYLIDSMHSKYSLGMEPYNGRILSRLFCYGLLPKTLKGKHLQVLLNYVDCESHREKLIKTLKALR